MFDMPDFGRVFLNCTHAGLQGKSRDDPSETARGTGHNLCQCGIPALR